MIPVPNDMNFAQHSHPGSHVYPQGTQSHSNVRNYNSHPANRGLTQPQQFDQAATESKACEKSSPTPNNNNNQVPTSSSSAAETPKSLPDLSSSNGTIVSTPEKEATTHVEEDDQAVNGSSILSPPKSDRSSPTSSVVVNGNDNSRNSIIEKIGNTKIVEGGRSVFGCVSVPERVEVVPTKHVNGNSKNETSKDRDILSAEQIPASDAPIEQTDVKSSKSPEAKTYSSSVVKNSRINSANTPAAAPTTANKDNSTANDNSTTDISVTTSVSLPAESKPQAAGRSWASIASAKSQHTLNSNDGATIRHLGNNIVHPVLGDESASVSVSGKVAGSNCVVPSRDRKEGIFVFDAAADEFDPVANRLGEHFLKYALEHQSIPLAPRGLYNQSNSCFLNAVLQVIRSNF